MSLEEDLAELEYDTQGAYNGAARVTLNGKTLEPWTSQRIAIAMELRCHVMRLVGPEAAEFIARGSYPNMFRDVAIVMYLSSLSVDQLNEIDCSDTPRQKYLPRVYEWCESAGLTYGSELYLEGVALMDRILRGIVDSMPFLADTANGVKKKEVTNQPGNSGSSARPSKKAGTILNSSGPGSRLRTFFNFMRSLLCGTARSLLIRRPGSRRLRTGKWRH